MSSILKKIKPGPVAALLAVVVIAVAGPGISSPEADDAERSGDSDRKTLKMLAEDFVKADRAGDKKRDDDRRTPKAKRERLSSSTAYTDLSDSEARDLARRKFKVLDEPLWEPPS